MNFPKAVRDKSLPAKETEAHRVNDLVDPEATETVQTAHSRKKIEIDAERMRSSLTRLTSNSIDELEKLSSELEKLQEFLKSETEHVQHDIWSVLAGIRVLIETIAPWKDVGVASAPNARSIGRDKLKHWP